MGVLLDRPCDSAAPSSLGPLSLGCYSGSCQLSSWLTRARDGRPSVCERRNDGVFRFRYSRTHRASQHAAPASTVLIVVHMVRCKA